jgi:spore germination protein GerM
VLVVAAAAACALAGCGSSNAGAPAASTAAAATTTASAPPTTTTTGSAPAAAADTRTVTVYFADANAQRLVPETRSVPRTGSALRAALVALAAGPTGSGRMPALPAGTTIVGTNVAGGEALVNLSGEFTRGYPSGGAAAEFAVLAPLVYTATGTPGVSRVRFTVDGLTPQPAGSQYDWSGAFSRADFPGAAGGG